MTKKSRTPRTAAFKKKFALEALREDKTLGQLTGEHGVHPLQVGKWKKELITGLTIAAQCRLLEVPHSSYYCKSQPITASELQLMRRVDEIYTALIL